MFIEQLHDCLRTRGIAPHRDWNPAVVHIVYALVSIGSAALPGMLVYMTFGLPITSEVD